MTRRENVSALKGAGIFVLTLCVMFATSTAHADVLCVRNRARANSKGRVVLRNKIFKATESCPKGSGQVLDLDVFVSNSTYEQKVDGLSTSVASQGSSINALNSAVESLQFSNVIRVAKSGGDFQSVVDALSSITDAAEDNGYLVQIGPGEFVETDLVKVPGFVHLKGAGSNVTIVRADRSSSAAAEDTAAIELENSSMLSHVHIVNKASASTADTTVGILLREGVTPTFILDDLNRTVIDSVRVTTSPSNSSINAGVHSAGGVATIRDSVLTASGSQDMGGTFRAGLYVTGSGRVLVTDSNLHGHRNGAGIGYGLVVDGAGGPIIKNTTITGSDTAVYTTGGAGFTYIWRSFLQKVNAATLAADAGTTIILLHSQIGGNISTSGAGTFTCTDNTTHAGAAANC